MFTFSGLRSGLKFENQILRCAPSAARTFTLVLTCEWKHNGRALLPLCIRAASALPLLCLRVRCETGRKPGFTEALALKAPLHVISEIFLLLICAAAGSARALEQRRPCTRTSATIKFLLAHSKNGCKCDHFGRSLEPWIIYNFLCHGAIDSVVAWHLCWIAVQGRLTVCLSFRPDAQTLTGILFCLLSFKQVLCPPATQPNV